LGAIFKIEHGNIVNFLTSRAYAPPRVLKQHLFEFLEMLSYQAEQYLIPERGFEPWPKDIAALARETLSNLEETASLRDSSLVPPSKLATLLKSLQNEFTVYPIYAMAVGGGNLLRQAAMDLARAPLHGQLLVLIPENGISKRNFEVLDPLPAISTALHSAPDWPGFVFWTQTGTSAFVALSEYQSILAKLRDAQFGDRPRQPFPFPLSTGFDEVLLSWAKTEKKKYRRLLHLSDLHFGTDEATENQAILDSELSEIIKDVDRVVITGDLFDTPKKNYATLFTNFRNNITRLSGGREPISITGNHDQRMIGLFGDSYKEVALIGPQKIVVDDQSRMIFICFNSSEKGSFARGRISKSQFRMIGGEYRTLLASRPELKEYLPIVLIHHHPFTFEVPTETLVQKALKVFGISDEKLLVLANANELHQWCIDWNIKTILHGHKHKARYVEREIAQPSGYAVLTAIGCGSSLGAEGSPVSYNLLEWAPDSQKWVTSFHESVNGGAFRETIAAVSP
jgi:Calcineurin-like phosphoesterase